MQSVATGQVLGKLLTECGELDLDCAAEMSDSGKNTVLPGEQRDPGAGAAADAPLGFLARAARLRRALGDDEGHRASASGGEKPIAGRVTLTRCQRTGSQPGTGRWGRACGCPGDGLRGCGAARGGAAFPPVPARDAPNWPEQGAQCGSAAGCF